MNKKIVRACKIITFVGFCILPSVLFGQIDTTEGRQFFTDLEKTLRTDYLLCTGDSAARTLDELIEWRRSIDSIIAGAEYPVIVRKFTEETGISAADARPCEIIRWMESVERQYDETSRFLAVERDNLLRRRNDSLYLLHELAGAQRAAYDLAAIPFGISRHSVVLLAQRGKLSPITGAKGTPVVCDSVPIGIMTFKAAFHFLKDDRYWCYDLESETCSIDSLDSWARPLMDYLAAHIETSTSRPPDHIYRVGLFDIVPGRLSICKLWNFESATAYAGFARVKNRFYAKAIVQSK